MGTTIEVRGGDFTKGVGWFYRGVSFVLRAANGRPASISFSQLEAVDQASEISLQIFGADETLRRDFEHAVELIAPELVAAGHCLFIAKFTDGRLLLASTDQNSFEEICAAGADNGNGNQKP
jgi:hypothetical protein